MRKIKNFCKKICCKLGWHSYIVGYDFVEYDGYYGIANKYKCKWCGYIGMVDSQGNLF